MSDSVEAVAPQPTRAELVAHGPKGLVETGAIKPEKFKLIDDARKHSTEGNGKEGIRDFVGANAESSFSTLRSNALLEKFGGGKVKYNELKKEFDIPTEESKKLTTAERSSFEGAKNVVGNLTNFLEYFEIASEIGPGRTAADVIGTKKDFAITTANY